MLNDTNGAAVLRPPGHTLMLMMRAAVAESGDAGPWLTITRARPVRPGEAPVYHHHINLMGRPANSAHRLVLLTGDEALSHALEHNWPDISNPTRIQLFDLAVAAIERLDVERWAVDYDSWVKAYESQPRQYERIAHSDKSASDARAMRWVLAEQWLRGR